LEIHGSSFLLIPMKKDSPKPDTLESQPIPDDPHKKLKTNLA
jgi:hypothetical protein